MKKLTQHERYELATELCRRINAAPAYLYDDLQMVSGREYHLDVTKVERLLKLRGHIVGDGESIADVCRNVYGDRVVELMQKLI